MHKGLLRYYFIWLKNGTKEYTHCVIHFMWLRRTILVCGGMDIKLFGGFVIV